MKGKPGDLAKRLLFPTWVTIALIVSQFAIGLAIDIFASTKTDSVNVLLGPTIVMIAAAVLAVFLFWRYGQYVPFILKVVFFAGSAMVVFLDGILLLNFKEGWVGTHPPQVWIPQAIDILSGLAIFGLLWRMFFSGEDQRPRKDSGFRK